MGGLTGRVCFLKLKGIFLAQLSANKAKKITRPATKPRGSSVSPHTFHPRTMADANFVHIGVIRQLWRLTPDNMDSPSSSTSAVSAVTADELLMLTASALY